MEAAWRLKMKPWGVYRSVVADSINLMRSRSKIRIHFKVKSWIRMGFEVIIWIRICNPSIQLAIPGNV
jgi:hypothetical protein